MIEIECNNLSKSYGGFQAVKHVSLQVQTGEIFGFVGPNGAGKTTTIRLLMGMLIPSNGNAKIHGLDCHIDRAEIKRWVGYLPDNPTYPDYLRGEEILRFVGDMHGLSRDELHKRIKLLLEQFSLSNAAFEFANNYSMGMKRKLGLACAQLHDPLIYILDEPTNGLDPIGAREVQSWIISSAKSGKTIFLSTHLLSMVENLCHRVCIINDGQLLASGSLKELKDKHGKDGSLEDIFLSVVEKGV